MIVDDDEANIALLRRILEFDGDVAIESTTDPREAIDLFDRFQPDLVLLDLHMPHVDGLELLRLLQLRIPRGTYLPILIMTADTGSEVKQRALAGGAKEFLTQPFSTTEARLRIHNLLETRFLHLYVQQEKDDLEDRVRRRTAELEEARTEILHRLARAAEFRDDATGQHTRRVGHLAAEIARTMGAPAEQVDLIYRAAPLHDIGKIGIPDTLLLKKGKLSAKQLELMRTHTTIGAHILSGSRVPVLRCGEAIALTHHEWWNGGGYPNGLKGESIPFAGRVVAVADVFDSLTHTRCYKPAWPLEQAADEIRRQQGHQFDPGVVEAFLDVYAREHLPLVAAGEVLSDHSGWGPP